MGVALVVKRCHELLVKKQGNVAYCPVHPTVKNCLPAVYNTRQSILKMGVVKLIKEDWPTLLQ